MMHLVNPIRQKSFEDTLADLSQAHSFLARGVTEFLASHVPNGSEWKAIDFKRSLVSLPTGSDSPLIGKTQESFAEVINIMATIERTIDGVNWFAAQPTYSNCIIQCCHPATSSKTQKSDENEDNDLVIVTPDNKTAILCEVTDVVSRKANTNGKERKDLKNLGCENKVPRDEVERYICTSQEFGEALAGDTRLWHKKCYKYEVQHTDTPSGTLLLRILPND